ncbi:reverse transcriptase domain, reverse transcriptase zinc-binding domain protein [Tanacetum coccineum]
MSWGWRKILSLRPSIRKFIRSKLGNGMNTSLWFDTWSVLEPIASFVSPRDIARAGLSLRSNVMDIIQQGTLEWYDRNGNAKKFSVSQVWDDIRCRDNHVEWYSMVWFSACIPRHALNMWLIFRRKLRTQDLIPSWDVSTSLGNVCSLCETVMDSHEHIFFECSFSQGIWDRIKRLAGLERYPPNIYDIFHTMLPFINRRTTCSVVAKLLIAAAAYYVWQERNWRLFKKGKRSPDQLVECIRSSVRLRLFSCTFKKSKDGERMAKLWDLPEAIFR